MFYSNRTTALTRKTSTSSDLTIVRLPVCVFVLMQFEWNCRFLPTEDRVNLTGDFRSCHKDQGEQRKQNEEHSGRSGRVGFVSAPKNCSRTTSTWTETDTLQGKDKCMSPFTPKFILFYGFPDRKTMILVNVMHLWRTPKAGWSSWQCIYFQTHFCRV